jgi:hypothetical protein
MNVCWRCATMAGAAPRKQACLLVRTWVRTVWQGVPHLLLCRLCT